MKREEILYHEHPLRILRYSAKNIWLLVFPALRGMHAFTFDADRIYRWIKGAWLDIAVLGIILLFGLVSWNCSRIKLTENAIIHISGVLIKSRKIIPASRISTFLAERRFYLRPFHAVSVSCNTAAGSPSAADMRIMVSDRVFRKITDRLDIKKSEVHAQYRYHKPRLMNVVMFSLFFSSSFSGAVYIAAFFFRGGIIARDIISLSFEKFSEGTSKLAGILLEHIPAAAIGVGVFFLGAWLISFITNLLRYSGFVTQVSEQMLLISCGVLTRRSYLIYRDKINYTELRQNLIMKLFRIAAVNICCAGYNTENRRIPVLFPIRKAQAPFGSRENELGGRVFRPRMTSMWQYVWAPVIGAVSLYPLCTAVKEIFPGFSELTVFMTIMAEILLIWLVIIKITACLTSRICISDSGIIVKYSVGFAFHTVYAKREKLIKLCVTQSPFQRLSGKAAVALYFREERSKRHYVKAVKIQDAVRIAQCCALDREEEK